MIRDNLRRNEMLAAVFQKPGQGALVALAE